jgi:FAD/FMN-containing dehydrogenase
MFLIQQYKPWTLRPIVSAQAFQCERPSDFQKVASSILGRISISAKRTAYGDCCVPVRGGLAFETTRLSRILSADWESGEVEAGPGLQLRNLANVSVPRGWFLGASPGTMKSTVGGCVACDVHGKNHHVAGSFGNWVTEFDLLGADGSLRTCSPASDPHLFWATIGGLGHTGIVVRVKLKLQRIHSGWIRSKTIPTFDLDNTLATIEAHPAATYSVSWLDSLASGTSLGRGVVMLGEHASREEAEAEEKTPIPPWPTREISIPVVPPNWASPAVLWKVFNAAYHALACRNAGERLVPLYSFFYPLDRVRNWNVVYGRRGFLEYQFAVPLKGGLDVCRRVCEKLAATGNGSFLAVIKRFGPGNAGHLSFPIEGYTLAVDMPFRGEEQERILRKLDELVANAGGRIYLVKDNRLPPEWVPVMYPRLQEWREIVARVDPNCRFVNYQTARLNLRGSLP